MSVKLRRKKIKENRYSLYLDIYDKGRRYYEFLNLYLEKDKGVNKETERMAENIRARKQLEIASLDHGMIPSHKKNVSFIKYFESLVNKKPKDEKCWKNTLNYLKKFTDGDISFKSITESWLDNFKEYLLSRENLSQNTARSYFAKMRTSLNQAVRDKILMVNPAKNVSQIKIEEIKRTYLTFDEIQKLASTHCEHLEVKRAFIFACYTGIRKGDVFDLKWDDIRKENINGETNYKINFRQQKTKGVEYFYLSKSAQKILDIENIDLAKQKGKRVFDIGSHSLIDRVLKIWAARAGIDKNVHFHVSRHTFATLYLSQEKPDIYILSKLLGHRSLQTTQIYAKIVDEKLREAVNLLPEIKVSLNSQ